MSGIRNPENFEVQINTNESLSISRSDLYSIMLANLKFEPSERVLDYGCGTGKFFKTYLSEIAIANRLKLVGVDISEDMIQHAHQNSSISGITEYRVGNILEVGDMSLESEEGKFDKIFATFLIQVVEDYGELFKKLGKYLKPGGTFSAIIPTNWLARPFTLLPEVDKFWQINYPEAMSYLASWVLQDPAKGEFIPFDKSLVTAGYKVLDYRHQLLVLEFEDISKYWSHFIGNHGSLSSIPIDSALYEKLKEDLTEIARNKMNVNVDQKPFVNESQIYIFTAQKN